MQYEHYVGSDLSEIPKDIQEAVCMLADLLFGEKGGTEIRSILGLPGAAWTVAFDDGKVAGFKAGFQDVPGRFYSATGGVHPDYRKRGIATGLMKAQHRWCADHGFKLVRTETKNEFRAMLVLNIKNGFDVVGTFTDRRGVTRIILEKWLGK